MKNTRLVFTDEEHADLLKAKGEKSWHDFIVESGRFQKVNQKNTK